MAVDISAIRVALATAVDSVTGVRAYPRDPGQTVTSSEANTAVVVVPGDDPMVHYNDAFRGGLSELHMRLEVRCQLADFTAAQKRVEELLSAGTGTSRSLHDAVRTDPTLAGAVSDCLPTEARIVGVTDGWLVAEIDVRIITRRITT